MRLFLLALPPLLLGACLSLSEVEDAKKQPVPQEDAAGVIDVYTSDVGLYCEDGKKLCNGKCVPYDDPAYGCGVSGCAACNLPGANAICQNLACKLTECLLDFEDCDQNEANGCEANLKTDVANCGACGSICGSAHSSPTCTDGVCVPSCDPGYGDCNHLAPDGCESPIDTTSNCGTCGLKCGSSFVCTSGSCRCNSDSDCTGGTLQQISGTCTDAGLCDCDNGKLCKAGAKCSNFCDN